MTNFSKEKEEKEEAGGEEKKKKMTLWEAMYKFQQLPMEKRHREKGLKKALLSELRQNGC